MATTKLTDAKLRSLELIDFQSIPDLKIHIVGKGAVGSRVFEQLICLGARNITCYDFDHVEGHNLHNQLWIANDIGKSKCSAARGWFTDKYNKDPDDFDIEFVEELVTKDMAKDFTGIVMLCVDTFDGRRDIMAGCVESEGNVKLVIEGRCAPAFNNVRCVEPSDEKQVEAFYGSLGSDDDPDVHVTICGLPISFAPVMIACATQMVMQGVNFIKNGDMTFDDNRLTNFISSPMLVLGATDL